jgi:hypothetical protein
MQFKQPLCAGRPLRPLQPTIKTVLAYSTGYTYSIDSQEIRHALDLPPAVSTPS